MIYLVICAAALAGSMLTFFSGFGLGTLLVPVFALFFPIELAIALTAVVHFLNNLFKLALVGGKADAGIVLRFGIPSLVASFLGALALLYISGTPPLHSYTLGSGVHEITAAKLVIAVLLLVFVSLDLSPRFTNLQFNQRYLVAGGLLSGFFGGLSGNQGALRSAFLIKAGLQKEVFIATGVVIACLVDIARLGVYWRSFFDRAVLDHALLMLAATGSAFAGAFAGSRLIRKVTLKTVQLIVASMLVLFAVLLGAGIL